MERFCISIEGGGVTETGRRDLAPYDLADNEGLNECWGVSL